MLKKYAYNVLCNAVDKRCSLCDNKEIEHFVIILKNAQLSVVYFVLCNVEEICLRRVVQCGR